MILSESIRFFRRNRLLSFSAIGVIALGMAASAIVLNVLLLLLSQKVTGLEQRPYVTIGEQSNGGLLRPVSWETIRLLALKFNGLSLGAYAEPVSVSVKAGIRQYQIQVAAVSPDFFARFSKPLSAGTGLSRSEEAFAGLNVVLLSPKLARDLFGTQEKALDQFVTIKGASLRVAGIAPDEFHGLFGKQSDAWIPPNCAVPVYVNAPRLGRDLPREDASRLQQGIWRRLRIFYMIAYRRGAGAKQTSHMINSTLEADHSLGVNVIGYPQLTIDPEQDSRLRRWAGLAFFLALLLNLASGLSFGGLLLARAPRQLVEVRLKRTLGASAARLIGELSIGPLSIVLAGYICAIVLAVFTQTAIQQGLKGFGSVLAFSQTNTLLAVLSQLPLVFLVGILMALVPAARLLRESGAPHSSYTATETRRATRIFQGIVVAQITICTCSCIVAAMVARSAIDLGRQPLGFQAKNRSVFAVAIRRGVTHLEYSTDSRDNFPLAMAADNIMHQLSALPQVESVAMAMAAPLDPSARSWILHKLDSRMDESWTVNYNGVTSSYFKTLGTPLIAGHGFTGDRMVGDPTEAVVNQVLAKQLWPEKDAIGKNVRLDDPSGLALTVKVIGIVSDQRLGGPKDSPAPTVYVPLRGNIFASSMPIYVLVEGQQPTFTLENIINRAIAPQMPNLNVNYSYLVSDRLKDLTSAEARRVWLAGTGAVMITLVAFIGLYSSVAYAVNTRRRELAIRASCGATPNQICGIVSVQALQSGAIAAGATFLCWGFLQWFVRSGWVGAFWSDTVAVEAMSICLLLAVLITAVPSLHVSRIPLAVALRDERQ